MPEEFSRTTARKKVLLPSGDTINVPVITKISFIDPFNQHQEYQYLIDNTEDVDRKVHVDNVHPVDVDQDGVPTEDAPTQDTSQDLFVERVETFKVVDPFNQYQESQPTLDNTTGNDLLPPHFSNHQKTHIYRYHQDPQNPDDNGVWVDSELIDELAFIDPFEQYQERQLILVNPTNAEFRDGDLSGQASEDDPDLTIGEGDGEGTEDNPVRLDPFQNIVNYSSGHYLLAMRWRWHDWHIVPVNAPPTYVEPAYTIPSDLEISLEPPTGEGITLLFDEIVVIPNNPVVGCNEYVLTKIYDVPNPPGNFTTDPADCFTWTGSMTGGTITSGSGSPDFEQRYTKTPNDFQPHPTPPTAFITDSYEDASVGPYPSFFWHIYSTNEYEFNFYLWNPGIQNIPIEYIGPTGEEQGPVFVGTQGAAAIQNTPQSDHFYQFPSTPPFPGGPQGPDGTYKYQSLYNAGQFEFKLANLGTATIAPDETVAKIAAWPSLPVVISVADGTPTSLTYPPTPPYSLGIYSAFGREWLEITGGGQFYKFGGPTINSNKYTGTNP